MKRILVPTDFSRVANNALKYAIEIAGDFNAELYLYHVYHIHVQGYMKMHAKHVMMLKLRLIPKEIVK